MVTSVTAAQSTDCDGNGIDDALQWGPEYAYWNGNGVGNDGGLLNDWTRWCPADPSGISPLDMLVFGQLAGQPSDLCTLVQSLSAWSLRVEQGAFEIQSPDAGITLSSTPSNASIISIDGGLILDATVAQSGSNSWVSIGNAGSDGVMEVRGHSVSTDGYIIIGATGTGELAITGGAVSCQALSIGGTTPMPGTTSSARLSVGTAGSLQVTQSLQINDVARVDGTVEIVKPWGGVFGVYNEMAERPVLAGTGKIVGAVHAAELAVIPRLGTGPDGTTDAVLTINGTLAMSYPETNLRGVLRIAVRADPTSGAPIVPMVEAQSVGLGGTLRLFIDPATLGDLPAYNPVVRSAPEALLGDFAAVEVTGLPNNRVVKLVRPTTMDEVGFTIVAAPPSPSVESGPTSSLLRVVNDAVFGDFNHDGSTDVAMAMAVDASGVSQVRFFAVGNDNTLTLKATVDLEGDARDLATLAIKGADRLAVALGIADKCALLTAGDGWSFATTTVATGIDTLPSSIAVGRFVDTAAPLASELAIGCLGTNQIKIFGSAPTGQYELITTVDGVRADVLRSAAFDATQGHDLLALARSTRMATIITQLHASTATTRSIVLPTVPYDATVVSLEGSQGRQSCVIALSGVGSDPDVPIDSGIILRLTANEQIDVVASLNIGDDPLSITSADFDEDGDHDIAAATTVAGVEQVRLLFNTTDPATPQLISFQDGGAMAGAIRRPRIVIAQDAQGVSAARLLSVNAGAGSGWGGSLGPEFDGGVGTFGGGGGVTGDVNGDGVVNGVDLTSLFSAWGTAGPAADLNGDGIVDANDMASVLSGWSAP